MAVSYLTLFSVTIILHLTTYVLGQEVNEFPDSMSYFKARQLVQERKTNFMLANYFNFTLEREDKERKHAVPFGNKNFLDTEVSNYRCSLGGITLYPNATFCDDLSSDCDKLFPKFVNGKFVWRNEGCNDIYKQDDVTKCRKSCSVCCENQKFTNGCRDDPKFVEFNCAEHKRKCYQPEFYRKMIKSCPFSCGFCHAHKCENQMGICSKVGHLCKDIKHKQFLEINCAKTCGMCGVTTKPEHLTLTYTIEKKKKLKKRLLSTTTKGPFPIINGNKTTKKTSKLVSNNKLSASSILLLDPKKTVSASSDPCTDSLDICPKWKENGFCSSQFYSKSYRASICRKSCTMC